jgi:hypothetical protein
MGSLTLSIELDGGKIRRHRVLVDELRIALGGLFGTTTLTGY